MALKNSGEALSREAAVMRTVAKEIGRLQELGLAELRAQYQQVYGEEARSKNLPYLRKKLAFRLQEQTGGSLSAAAQSRLEDISSTEAISQTPATVRREPRPAVPLAPLSVSNEPNRDPRLPIAGTSITREFKGFAHEVQVLEHEFIYRGRTYRSLSAIAKEITGTPWNGFLFFGLITRGGRGGQA